MKTSSQLFEMGPRVHHSSTNTTAMCECTFKGQAAVAIFAESALFLEYRDPLDAEKIIRVQIAGCLHVQGIRDGMGWEARFRCITGMAYVPRTNELVACDNYSHTLRTISLSSPFVVKTMCGDAREGAACIDGPLHEARFSLPHDVCAAPNGFDLYVTDYGNHAVRKVDLVAGTVESIFGNGAVTHDLCGRSKTASNTQLSHPMGIKMDNSGQFVYVVNFGEASVCKLELAMNRENPPGRWVSAFATESGYEWPLPTAIEITPGGHLVVWRECWESRVIPTFPNTHTGHENMCTITLYNKYDGTNMFEMCVVGTVTAFSLRKSLASANTPASITGGTTICVLQREFAERTTGPNHRLMCSIPLRLGWKVLRLLLLATIKPNSRPPQRNTALTFALLPVAILQHIVAFANDPFRIAAEL